MKIESLLFAAAISSIMWAGIIAAIFYGRELGASKSFEYTYCKNWETENVRVIKENGRCSINEYGVYE